MVDVQENYRYFEEVARPVSFPEDQQRDRADLAHLPAGAAATFRKYGKFSTHEGRMIFCQSQLLSGVLPLVFHGDSDLHHSHVSVYAYSAFGTLFCWSHKLKIIEIDLFRSIVKCKALLHEKYLRYDPDMVFAVSSRLDDPDLLDAEDHDGKLLFSRAKKKLGPLNYGECYGFRLAPALGGRRTLDKLERVSAPEHFSFLAQLQPFTLIDYDTTQDFGLRVIRQIG